MDISKVSLNSYYKIQHPVGDRYAKAYTGIDIDGPPEKPVFGPGGEQPPLTDDRYAREYTGIDIDGPPEKPVFGPGGEQPSLTIGQSKRANSKIMFDLYLKNRRFVEPNINIIS